MYSFRGEDLSENRTLRASTRIWCARWQGCWTALVGWPVKEHWALAYIAPVSVDQILVRRKWLEAAMYVKLGWPCAQPKKSSCVLSCKLRLRHSSHKHWNASRSLMSAERRLVARCAKSLAAKCLEYGIYFRVWLPTPKKMDRLINSDHLPRMGVTVEIQMLLAQWVWRQTLYQCRYDSALLDDELVWKREQCWDCHAKVWDVRMVHMRTRSAQG